MQSNSDGWKPSVNDISGQYGTCCPDSETDIVPSPRKALSPMQSDTQHSFQIHRCIAISGVPEDVEAQFPSFSVTYSNIKWGDIGPTYTT